MNITGAKFPFETIVKGTVVNEGVEKEPIIQNGECKLLNQCKNNVVAYRSKSNYVLMLQTMLLNLGYNPNGVDGHCGNGMVSAIKQYQRDNGLSADGSCGPATWTNIFTK